MKTQKYEINHHQISTILNWIKIGEIAMPEIQRPFVWNTTQVRDLMDSLYLGHPSGFLIVWQNPNVRLKDDTKSTGKKILIDGQQRITSLTAAILGQYVVDSNYNKKRIQIAFHPLREQFEVKNSVIEKDSSWIADISTIFSTIFDPDTGLKQLVDQYREKNPNVDEGKIWDSMTNLIQLTNRDIGMINLIPSLDIEDVTVIFEKVNSSGVPLSQADFAMSRIAVHGKFGGNLRKLIDHFAHIVVSPDFFNVLVESDTEFPKKYLEKIKWLKNETDDLYDPKYYDVLRVAFTSEFDRGKISDLVSLLSGRNFETREFEKEIQDDTFKRLEKSILEFVNEYNFKKFTMIIRSAGFINSGMITSQNALNAAYILYMKLRQQKMHEGMIERYIQKWFVMSLLTGRYSSSPETAFHTDVEGMKDFVKYFEGIEQSELSDSFWNVTLPRELEKSSRSNPFLNVFIASRVRANNRGFLSSNITVRDLILQRGDMHHIFPRNFLKKKFTARKEYNQIANMVYTQTEINVAIRDKPPAEYMTEMKKQCNGGNMKYGNITDMKTLDENLVENCIPPSIFEMRLDDYPQFLKERRILMAKKIEQYFKSL